jgi:hypothetical protein
MYFGILKQLTGTICTKPIKPRFEYLDQLPKNDPQSAQKAAQYLVDMTKDLADSHLDISFNGLATYVVSGYQIQGYDFQASSIRHQLRGDRMPIPGKVPTGDYSKILSHKRKSWNGSRKFPHKYGNHSA